MATEDSEQVRMHSRENLYCLKRYLNHFKWTIGRNMDIKATDGESSEGMKKMETGGKGYSCY